MPKKLNRYLVISYDNDEQQWFHDTVFAKNAETAETRILDLRDYCIAANVTSVEELEQVLNNVKKHTREQSETYLAQLAYEKDERNVLRA
jgi:hypothetical protein